MNRTSSFIASLILIILVTVTFANAQSERIEREFDHPIDDLKQALQALHADETAKLPTLRGFVTDSLSLGTFERPYYEFESELVERNPDRTLLRVKARITAWHTDMSGGAQEYRSLTSNGRLESDLLDRIDKYLVNIDSDLSSRITMLEKKLADLNTKSESLKTHCAELAAQNKRLEDALQSQSEERKQRMVLRSGTRIFEHPSPNSHALATAERDDLFEVSDERPGWIAVRLDGDATGWLPIQQTKPITAVSDRTALSAALKEKPKPFVVTRESVTPFLGDWPALKGKKALFLWAQPVGLSRRESNERLLYIKQEFADRYRDALHADASYAGLVIIFMGTGAKNGVAAARLDDIGQWLNGRMPDNEFLKRCSLDPPDVFLPARAVQK